MRGYCVRALTKLAGVFIYDYVLTFVQEVQLIWHRRITGATVLFVLNRYLTLMIVLMSLIGCWPATQQSTQVCEVSRFYCVAIRGGSCTH